MNQQCSAVIMGVEAEHSLNATLAQHIAAQGLHVYIAGYNEETLQKITDNIKKKGGKISYVVADATNEYHIDHLFDVIHFDNSTLEFAVYNVDNSAHSPILETKAETFTRLWEQNCLGAFLFAKEAIECMKPYHQGTLIYTGATTSIQTKPAYTAYASAKAALRTLAQGLAREFSPEGIHILHASIDDNYAAQQLSNYYRPNGNQGKYQFEAIAETYWAIHNQHPSAWTHELDIRTFNKPL